MQIDKEGFYQLDWKNPTLVTKVSAKKKKIKKWQQKSIKATKKAKNQKPVRIS